jgi:hypothetical protein
MKWCKFSIGSVSLPNDLIEKINKLISSNI